MSRFIFNRLAAAAIVASALVACSSNGPDYGPTLASLTIEDSFEEPLPIPKTSIKQIEQTYRSALDVARDPEIRHQILVRLADLEMARSQEDQLDDVAKDSYFNDAVTMYEELITLNSSETVNGETMSNERLLYQLSKAYALDGRMQESKQALAKLVAEYPTSMYATEAVFRRAEQAFSDGDYVSAEVFYKNVMAVGDATPFYGNAVYMHGWSQFKQNKNRASLRSFTEVLDRLIPEGQTLTGIANSDRSLVEDTLRVMSIVFSYLDGAPSITEIYRALGERHYQHLIYMALGDLYLEKDRFRDSADTYQHYVENFPQTDYSPGFSVKAIEVYGLGNFPSLVLPAKEIFVRNYGVYSTYWQARDENLRETLKPNLLQYLDELSSYYHAQALANIKVRSDIALAKSRGEKTKLKAPKQSPVEQFLQASAYYQQFVDTFPQDPRTPEMTFLMAESYYEAGQLREAVKAYETVAYNYLDTKRGADSGYAALVALQQLIETAPRTNDTETTAYQALQAHHTNSAVNFADYYPNDARATAVLTSAAQDVFNSGDLPRALALAERMTQWQPAPEKSLLKTAWLLVAHSHYDLQAYVAAEAAYREILVLLGPIKPAEKPSQERVQVVERIAASMYKIAEQQVVDGDKPAAVLRLLAINEVAPNSEIAIKGQYDAATYLMELEEWSRAEDVLLRFQSLYSSHPLSANLLPKLALIYQSTGQWQKAASILAKMSESGDPDVRRQSLFLSAELYEKAGRIGDAINQYRNYANNYVQPFDIATEARAKLVELYGKTGDDNKRNFWLQKLIDEDKKAGSKRTPRSKTLAAMAASKFANDEYQRFSRLKLTLPIKKSLKAKKSAMDQTLKLYGKVMEYGVAEYVTDASYKIGLVYGQLSRDLIDSERPSGLDDLALEQYEILLEEQAFPFEEKAIDIHAGNAERAWQGIYDEGVKNSFDALAKLLPARYGKQEQKEEVSRGLR